jgi:hypothetical protein
VRRLVIVLIAGIILAVAAGFVIWQELAPSGQGGNGPTGLALGQGSASGTGPWTVFIQGSNAGGSSLTISGVLINGRDSSSQVSSPSLPIVVQPSSSFSFSVAVASGGGVTYSAGQALEVEVDTSDGLSYSTQVSLPASTGSPGGGSGGAGGEDLVLSASVIGGALNVTVLNESPGSVTVMQVYFNSIPAPITRGSGFDQGGQLASAASGTFTVPTSGTISGTTYDIEVITGGGNRFSTTVVWP